MYINLMRRGLQSNLTRIQQWHAEANSASYPQRH